MVTLDQGGRARGRLGLAAPPPALAGWVEHSWALSPAAADRGMRWRIVPDASPHLIATRLPGGPVRVGVVGARTRWVDADQGARLFTVGVRLRPGSLPALLGGPAWEATDRSVSVAEAWGAAGRGLVERLSSEDNPESVRRLLLAAIAERLGAACTVDWRVRRLVEELPGPRGRLRIGTLARELGTAPRSLREVTRAEIGLSPKRTWRILRLHVGLRHTLAGAAGSAAAHRSGYADQPHFIRECRALLGETPARFRGRGADSYNRMRARGR